MVMLLVLKDTSSLVLWTLSTDALMLRTDWGDNGHFQTYPISMLGFFVGSGMKRVVEGVEYLSLS